MEAEDRAGHDITPPYCESRPRLSSGLKVVVDITPQIIVSIGSVVSLVDWPEAAETLLCVQEGPFGARAAVAIIDVVSQGAAVYWGTPGMGVVADFSSVSIFASKTAVGTLAGFGGDSIWFSVKPGFFCVAGRECERSPRMGLRGRGVLLWGWVGDCNAFPGIGIPQAAEALLQLSISVIMSSSCLI